MAPGIPGVRGLDDEQTSRTQGLLETLQNRQGLLEMLKEMPEGRRIHGFPWKGHFFRPADQDLQTQLLLGISRGLGGNLHALSFPTPLPRFLQKQADSAADIQDRTRRPNRFDSPQPLAVDFLQKRDPFRRPFPVKISEVGLRVKIGDFIRGNGIEDKEDAAVPATGHLKAIDYDYGAGRVCSA